MILGPTAFSGSMADIPITLSGLPFLQTAEEAGFAVSNERVERVRRTSQGWMIERNPSFLQEEVRLLANVPQTVSWVTSARSGGSSFLARVAENSLTHVAALSVGAIYAIAGSGFVAWRHAGNGLQKLQDRAALVFGFDDSLAHLIFISMLKDHGKVEDNMGWILSNMHPSGVQLHRLAELAAVKALQVSVDRKSPHFGNGDLARLCLGILSALASHVSWFPEPHFSVTSGDLGALHRERLSLLLEGPLSFRGQFEIAP